MGKLNHNRVISIEYPKAMVELYELQTKTFKRLCNTYGREYGISGMNIFYFFCMWKITKDNTGYEWERPKHKVF